MFSQRLAIWVIKLERSLNVWRVIEIAVILY